MTEDGRGLGGRLTISGVYNCETTHRNVLHEVPGN